MSETGEEAEIFDPRICELGEGLFWHPDRRSAFWFDILGRRLLSRDGSEELAWELDELHSAAGWIDRDRLILASETGLWDFHLATGERRLLAPLEADRPETRSNDGRADPWGGFWISTMGKKAEKGRGAIWRYHEGELRRLHDGVSIANAICFDRDRARAYFADTPTSTVWTQPVDPVTGWPSGPKRVFLDLSAEKLHPDGAVIDAAGRFWNAQWGSGRVACYDADGHMLFAESFPARQVSCPAFCGPDLARLVVTSAWEGMSEEERAREPLAGATFARRVRAMGVPAPRVRLP
ncbi:SMP-30/gluconolactonase/LRE family protein [Amaricoccus solimangrovi]|uniref:SMP-30/gluconolactonase/LRE family protein n=1 Tax=Amaricoccus solimangrovi TaxID=2589815 RepID=A0A501WF96_9RHOB|nr:SMP-30/gluconolactonase/LRE family protein [Amaricoccus solimangrovi]TPE48533.1 SMP-30/gluconolactonase/LRE family protein [Amaricoccus solimangrovi]